MPVWDGAHTHMCAPTHAPIEPMRPNRANDPARASTDVTQPFSIIAKPFCYNELSHFGVNSTILSDILEIFP
jgi:hypothetical protein